MYSGIAVTEAEGAAMAALYDSGLSSRAIARRIEEVTGSSRSIEWVRLQSGLSSAKVGARLNWNGATVLKILRLRGIPRRKRGALCAEVDA